jgi:heptosyltransferase-2
VTKGPYTSLLRTHPAVNRLHALPPGGKLSDLAAVIRGESYDVLLDAHGNLRSRMLRALVPGSWSVLKKHRVSRFLATWSAVPASPPHLVDRYMALGSTIGVTADDQPADVYADDADTVAARNLAPDDYVVLAPGAQHWTKRWPPDRWADLAGLIRRQGYQVVGLGLSHEAPLLPPNVAVSAFGHPLGVGIALCERARAVVAHDSGLMHVATAVRTPVVAIYGPTAPNLGYAPYRAEARLVSNELPCRPCSVYGGDRCPAGHHRCMTSLTAEDVLRALSHYL